MRSNVKGFSIKSSRFLCPSVIDLIIPFSCNFRLPSTSFFTKSEYMLFVGESRLRKISLYCHCKPSELDKISLKVRVKLLPLLPDYKILSGCGDNSDSGNRTEQSWISSKSISPDCRSKSSLIDWWLSSSDAGWFIVICLDCRCMNLSYLCCRDSLLVISCSKSENCFSTLSACFYFCFNFACASARCLA